MELFAILCLSVLGLILSRTAFLHAQEQKVVWSNQERPIAEKIRGLRGLADAG